MKKALTLVLASLLATGAFAEKSFRQALPPGADAKIAVVSLSVNNYGKALRGWDADFMGSVVNGLLESSQALLAADWSVIPTDSFMTRAEFQELAGAMRDLRVPEKDGKRLPLFGKNRRQLVRAQIDADKVKKLAELVGADFLVVIYSEWTVAANPYRPTARALSKNVLSLYDKDGTLAYTGRSDARGEKRIGVLGKARLDEDSIGQWTESYMAALGSLTGGR